MEKAPVFCNVLWQSREEAFRAPKGRISLACCPRCGFIYNTAFDGRLTTYSGSYENSLHYSAHFEKYADELAGYLVERYQLQGKAVVEIGCGRGEFLAKLIAAGSRQGVGFDPSLGGSKKSIASDDSLMIIGSRFNSAVIPDETALICCRHVLEHIEDPKFFVEELAAFVRGKKIVLFFEVPNFFYTLIDQGIWDIIYEHCAYYVRQSLIELFQRAQMTIIDARTRYANQFLSIEAIGDNADVNRYEPVDEPVITELAEKLSFVYNQKTQDWCQRLSDLAKARKKVMLWGAGSKGVTLLNALGINEDVVSFVVDVNPHKHGKFVPCTGQRVVKPEFCRTYRPDVVIVMNKVYEPEIRHKLGEMGLSPEILAA